MAETASTSSDKTVEVTKKDVARVKRRFRAKAKKWREEQQQAKEQANA